MKHTVIVETHADAEIIQVRLITDGGDCPGNMLVHERPYANHGDREQAEHFAYILAKQVGASALEGVTAHTQGFWLEWQAEHPTSETDQYGKVFRYTGQQLPEGAKLTKSGMFFYYPKI